MHAKKRKMKAGEALVGMKRSGSQLRASRVSLAKDLGGVEEKGGEGRGGRTSGDKTFYCSIALGEEVPVFLTRLLPNQLPMYQFRFLAKARRFTGIPSASTISVAATSDRLRLRISFSDGTVCLLGFGYYEVGAVGLQVLRKKTEVLIKMLCLSPLCLLRLEEGTNRVCRAATA